MRRGSVRWRCHFCLLATRVRRGRCQVVHVTFWSIASCFAVHRGMAASVPSVSPPAPRRLELPPLALGPPLVLAGVPAARTRKSLPSAPGLGYNPQSLEASGSVQLVLPGASAIHVASSATRAPPDKSLFVQRHEGRTMEPRLSLITLGVADLERATLSYEECLGLPRLKTPPSVILLNWARRGWRFGRARVLWPTQAYHETEADFAGFPSRTTFGLQPKSTRCYPGLPRTVPRF